MSMVKARHMCTECGEVFVWRFDEQLRGAQDHALDAHRDHPDPGSIVFSTHYGPRAADLGGSL